TARMADTLAALFQRYAARSEPSPFFNRERIALIRGMIGFRTGPEVFNLRAWLADEMLKAGDTRGAIAEMQALQRDAGDRGDTITAKTKPMYDRLAIAALRLGEQENCLTNPSADVCILPLAGGARHTKQEGARNAIARYTQI